jgi:regulator of protease activity HflC (stomatin/prohibitin superfamily)
MNQPKLNLLPGLPMLLFQGVFALGIAATGVVCFLQGVPYFLVILIALAVVWLTIQSGFIVNSPNHAYVMQLFGHYKGTLTETGYFWANPLFAKTKVTLKVQTFETGMSGKADATTRVPMKVNDKDGTPIEIAAVITYQVVSPSDAIFNVDNYEQFIHVQADAALRNLASHYRYDAQTADEFSLRGHIDEVSEKLKEELQQRLTQIGLEVLSAQISSLAYAPEIANAMLQRQQASAMIAARKLIVEGAVGMVEHALEELAKKQIVELDPARKAAMVSNLLVVLCSHGTPQPVVSTGTPTH